MLFIRSTRAGLVVEDRNAPRQVRVRVVGGYAPDTIRAEAGRPLRIVFRRMETAPFSELVVFPDFGKSATLPVREEIAVDLLPTEPGEYEFTCGMGMLRGKLVVVAANGATSGRETPCLQR